MHYSKEEIVEYMKTLLKYKSLPEKAVEDEIAVKKEKRSVSWKKVFLIAVLLFSISAVLTGCCLLFHKKKQDVRIGYEEQGSLIVWLDHCRFDAGSDGSAMATVICREKIDSDIVLTDETGTQIAVIRPDGRETYKQEIVISTKEARTGYIAAAAGDKKAVSIPYYVDAEVTEEMMQELFDTAHSIEDYALQNGGNNLFSKKTVSQIGKWLEKSENVSSVQIGEDYLLYTTKNGLVGSYGLGRVREGYAGSDFDPFASSDDRKTADEALEYYFSGRALGDVIVKSSQVLTNTKIIMLSPEVNDTGFNETRLLEKSALNRLSSMIGGKEVIEYKGEEAMRALRYGLYMDSGLVLLTTHGRLINDPSAPNKPMLVIMLGDMPDSSFSSNGTSENWTDFRGDVSKAGLNCRLIYDCTPASKTVYTVRATSNFIIEGMGDQYFDNTLVIFGVCFGGADQRLITAFMDHGAVGFIGAEKSTPIVHIAFVIEELVGAMEENIGKKSARDNIILADLQMITKELDKTELTDVTCRYYAEFYYQNETAHGYHEYYIGMKDDLDRKFYRSGSNEYSIREKVKEYSDLFKEKDSAALTLLAGTGLFSFTGTADFSSLVVEDPSFTSTARRVEIPDGGPIAGAEVTLYRWMNHAFKKVGTTITDEDGRYTFPSIPFGIYGVQASMETYHGEFAVEFNIQTADKLPKITFAAQGIIGNVVDDKTGKPIEDASVMFTYSPAPGNPDYGETVSSGVLTDQEGWFTAVPLESGIYSIVISKDGYEESEPVEITLPEKTFLTLDKEIRLKPQQRHPVTLEHIYRDISWGPDDTGIVTLLSGNGNVILKLPEGVEISRFFYGTGNIHVEKMEETYRANNFLEDPVNNTYFYNGFAFLSDGHTVINDKGETVFDLHEAGMDEFYYTGCLDIGYLICRRGESELWTFNLDSGACWKIEPYALYGSEDSLLPVATMYPMENSAWQYFKNGWFLYSVSMEDFFIDEDNAWTSQMESHNGADFSYDLRTNTYKEIQYITDENQRWGPGWHYKRDLNYSEYGSFPGWGNLADACENDTLCYARVNWAYRLNFRTGKETQVPLEKGTEYRDGSGWSKQSFMETNYYYNTEENGEVLSGEEEEENPYQLKSQVKTIQPVYFCPEEAPDYWYDYYFYDIPADILIPVFMANSEPHGAYCTYKLLERRKNHTYLVYVTDKNRQGYITVIDRNCRPVTNVIELEYLVANTEDFVIVLKKDGKLAMYDWDEGLVWETYEFSGLKDLYDGAYGDHLASGSGVILGSSTFLLPNAAGRDGALWYGKLISLKDGTEIIADWSNRTGSCIGYTNGTFVMQQSEEKASMLLYEDGHTEKAYSPIEDTEDEETQDEETQESEL